MAKITKLKPLENQKVRDGQYKVIGEQPPSNGKIQNKINEIIKTLNEMIDFMKKYEKYEEKGDDK